MKRPCAPWSSNFTVPVTLANRVSSLPRPTFWPAANLRPRCRTRIEPPVTRLPSNRFTPRRCDWLSRPLRELPWPFLCAICLLLLELDALDLDPGQRRAVAARHAHGLAAALLEDADLGAARFAGDDAEHLGAGHERRAGQHAAVVLADEQHLVDGHLVAGGELDAVHFDDGAWGHLDLASTALDDRKHVSLPKNLLSATRTGQRTPPAGP